MQYVRITKQEYDELQRKARLYDIRQNGSSNGGKRASATLTPEQRRERAKKAVAARIAKYGQKSKQ